MASHFLAYVFRMRLIRRWSLMQNSSPENIQEHSHRVALLAHVLGTIRKTIFNQPADPERAAFLALLHDAGEVMTGDLPTPVKYFDANIRTAYRSIEEAANQRLLTFLPPELRETYASSLVPREDEAENWELVKAADKLCAWLKCVEERRGGNREFLLAEETLLDQINAMKLKEIEYFMSEFAPGFSLTLDELGLPLGEG